MANFRRCFEPILKTEAGYTIDSGGETWRGVSRKFFPHWDGWGLVDNAKKHPGWLAENYTRCTQILEKVDFLEDKVLAFYKKEFWDKVGGDSISDNSVAVMLADAAVNEGIVPAIKRAQSIMGLPETGVSNQLLISKLNSL